MNLLDPKRSKVANRPGLLGFPAVVPDLHISPTGPETCEVRVMLGLASNSFRWHQTVVHNGNLAALLSAYFADPEALLASVFSWEPPKPGSAPAKSRSTPSLEEMDL